MILRSGIRLAQLAAVAGLAVALAPAAALASAAPAANGGWSVQSIPVPQAKILPVQFGVLRLGQNLRGGRLVPAAG